MNLCRRKFFFVLFLEFIQPTKGSGSFVETTVDTCPQQEFLKLCKCGSLFESHGDMGLKIILIEGDGHRGRFHFPSNHLSSHENSPMNRRRAVGVGKGTQQIGMNMGTRFIATQDAPVHQNVKEAIVGASELDTRLIMRSLTNTERVMNNDAVERLMEKEKALGDQLTFADIVDEVAGVYPKIMHEGTMDAGAWSCGMVAGLVNDIPTVKELIDTIMDEADAIISKRLSNF